MLDPTDHVRRRSREREATGNGKCRGHRGDGGGRRICRARERAGEREKIARPIVETNRAKFSRRAAKWRGDSLFVEHAQRELSRFRFGDDAAGARFGRRLRVDRIGLDGRLAGGRARFTADGPLVGWRKFGSWVLLWQTDDD